MGFQKQEYICPLTILNHYLTEVRVKGREQTMDTFSTLSSAETVFDGTKNPEVTIDTFKVRLTS